MVKSRRKEEIKSYIQLEKYMISKDVIFQYYKQLVEPMLIPDLYGKTIKVTNKVFSNIFILNQKISKIFGIKPPDIYVYESFYYGADTCGLSEPWIEISSKTISDFSEDELVFILAKQISHIFLEHHITKTHAEHLIKTINATESIPGVGLLNTFGLIDLSSKALELIYLNWHREITHTQDIYGMLFCGNLISACNAIIKLVINDSNLAKQITISDYLKQANYLASLKGVVAFYTVFDESVPYGPTRIKELIKFLSISNNKSTLSSLKKEFMNE